MLDCVFVLFTRMLGLPRPAGHPFGDSVRFLGDTLLQEVRETDLPCRYGGDEFCIVLPEYDSDDAELVCRKVIEVSQVRSWCIAPPL